MTGAPREVDVDAWLIPGMEHKDKYTEEDDALIKAAIPEPLVFVGRKKYKVRVETPAPDPAREDWIDFLHWLADDCVTAHDLVYCVEKPHKYAPEYAHYLVVGGVNREG